MLEVIPAIDIRGGKCVRLYQGDYSQETVFSEDPVAVARRWESCGAPRIHVVDLDGAAAGELVNTEIVEAIVRAVTVPVQMGGGLRTMEAIDRMLNLGVARIVLGTAAAEDPELVEGACARHGERIVAGIDAKAGLVATHGWKTVGRVTAHELVQTLHRLGVRRVVYTDIARDGAMSGPNFQAVRDLMGRSPVKVIASGGVSSLDHLRRLAALKVEGAVVGRAIYTGAVDLTEAVRVLSSP